MKLHKVRILVPDAQSVLTRIELDGEPLMGVRRVAFDTADLDGFAKLTIVMDADVEIVIDDVWLRWREPEKFGTRLVK